jgi:rubrerythrin
MPEFTDPFIGNVPDRKLTRGELIRAIRLDLAAEEEAIHIYDAQAEATDDPLAKAVLRDIANEEKEHVGEFARLLAILTGDEDKWIANGIREVDEIAAEVGVGIPSGASKEAETGAGAETAARDGFTIGSLRNKEEERPQ